MRKSLSKKTRFEVFKRDSFTCQYCGAKAPDAVLQADHIDPVANGGSDALLNLVTSCAACNGGKGATLLSDQSAVEKQRRQLEELQERRDQIDMMVAWQKGLSNVDDYAVEQISGYWSELATGWYVNENGKKTLRKLVKKYGIDGVMNGMSIAAEQYLTFEGQPPKATASSVQVAMNYVGRICGVREAEKAKPHLQKILWIRGCLRNSLNDCDDREALKLLDEAVEAGVALSDLERLAKTRSRWSVWESTMYRWMAEVRTEAKVDP